MPFTQELISDPVQDIGAPDGLTSSQAIANQGDTVPVKNSAGSKTVNGSAVVASGQVSQVDLPSTATLITSTQALTGVAPSGTYTTTVTFTVANGVISEIALS